MINRKIDGDAQQPNPLFSIGHSTHPLELFFQLLQAHGIEVVVDVRSTPYSRWAPHFSQKPLTQALVESGLKYLHFGDELGGKPANPQFYDDEGHVLYGKMAASAPFQATLDRIVNGMRTHTIALMCGEEDPTGCHRRLLIGRALLKRGIALTHIRGDGRLQTDAEIGAGKRKAVRPDAEQLMLFVDRNRLPQGDGADADPEDGQPTERLNDDWERDWISPHVIADHPR